MFRILSTTSEAHMAVPDDKGRVQNYMAGTSYQPFTPLQRLKLVAASFIRGEAKQYYRSSGNLDRDRKNVRKMSYSQQLIKDHFIYPDFLHKSSVDVFDECVEAALNDDFEGTIKFMVKLRREYFMRKNPQYIAMVAAGHSKRPNFNKEHPGIFKECLYRTIQRPDDMMEQLNSWKGLHDNKKNGLPTCVKKVWAKTLEEMKPYQLQKYKRYIPDLVRISHPRGRFNKNLTDIIKDGSTTVRNDQKTWETLRSGGMKWVDILNQLKWRLPHMAALRNIRGFTKETNDLQLLHKYGEMLVKGVEYGKQFPFRYITAYREIKTCNDFSNDIKTKLCDILERCLQESMKNFPKLQGDTISLCDNSGSAHGSFTSTYGSTKVSDIGNLSALFTAYNTEGRGVVGVFGDRLALYEVTRDKPLLKQLDDINRLGEGIGACTENGIWIFFRDAFMKHVKCNKNRPINEWDTTYKFDNLFIYSDMQAGHGGLYGIDPTEYKNYRIKYESYSADRYIDVLELVKDYRKSINTKLNVFTVQIAGYDNSLLPESLYRGAVLSGWTGNEVTYAKRVIELWNELEKLNM